MNWVGLVSERGYRPRGLEGKRNLPVNDTLSNAWRHSLPPGLYREQQGAAEVLYGPRDLLDHAIVAGELVHREVPQSRLVDEVDVVGNRVSKAPKAVFGTIALEVRFDPGGHHLGMEHGEYEPSPSHEAVPDLLEK